MNRLAHRARVLTRLAALAIGLVATSVSAVSAQTLTFDDVITSANGYNNNFTSYQGYTFAGFNVATTASLGSGTNAVSGTKFLLGQTADEVNSIGGLNVTPQFNLFTAYLSYRLFDAAPVFTGPIGLEVLGYQAGIAAPVFSQFVTVTNTATLFTFNFLNVEEVAFQVTPLGAQNAALALDNVQLAVVPEPSTFLLLAVGVAGLLLVTRRRRRC